MTNPNWKAHAYPLKRVTIDLQATRHTNRAALAAQLVEVAERLKAGDSEGEDHDDDYGYRFIVIEQTEESLFNAPASRR